MGGTSKQDQTQNSTTAPWSAAQPALQGILGQVQTGLNNTGLTGAETGAINTLEQNAGNMNQYAPAIQGLATNLLNGGGATDQAGNVQSDYDRYVSQTNPLASNMNYDPYSTPGMKDMLSTLTSDITNSTNGQFAAAGRDFSGANSMALGRGLTQGLAPALLGQYNENRNAQQGAAGNLYNAGNTNAGILSGLQQQKLANQGLGIGVAGAANDAMNAGANATLEAEARRRNIPVAALGMLAQIGVPIAGLGSQSTGTSHTEGQMSGADQFAKIMGGIGSIIPKGPMTFKF